MLGTIYKNIERRCNDEQEAAIERMPKDFSNLKEPLLIMVDSLTHELTSRDVRFAPDIERIVFWSIMPTEELKDFTDKIFRRQLRDDEKADIILKVLSDIHVNWIAENHDRFFDEKYEDEQYLFAPSELIGFEKLMENYVFLEDTLSALGLKTGVFNIQEGYERRRHQYIEQCGIKSTELLARHLQYCNNPGLSMDIRAWKSKPKVAEKMAIQIVRRNGYPERW